MAVEVKISEYGFAVVPVYFRINRTPNMHPLYYKIDTGANCTTIDRDDLSLLGYDDAWIRTAGKLLTGSERLTVASGATIDDCYRIELPEINIGGWVGYNWPITTSLSVPFRPLFGTDSMRFFNWHFDYENGICSFELISGKRQLLFDGKEQSIHSIEEQTQL